jgi:hypothetical protein
VTATAPGHQRLTKKLRLDLFFVFFPFDCGPALAGSFPGVVAIAGDGDLAITPATEVF